MPLARWYVLVNRCVLAALSGEPHALALVRETAAFGQRIGAGPAEMYGAVQRFALLRPLGRSAECEQELRAAAVRYPRLATLRCALAVLLAEEGRGDEAVALLERLTDDDCAAVPPDALWLASVSLLVLAAARLERLTELVALERLLAPHAGKIVLQGLAVCWGAVDQYLGVAHAALRRWDDAEQAFRVALRVHQDWRAEPLVRASLEGLSDVAERRRAAERPVEGGLTARERQVLGLLQGGAANKQIARELGISVRTVERHVTNLYSKIGARSRSQATALGLRMQT